MEKINVLLSIVLVAILSCNTPVKEAQKTESESESMTFPASKCSPDQFTNLVDSYDFSADLFEYFEDHSDWQDAPTEGVLNDAFYEQRNDRLEFEVKTASMSASESWKTWKKPLSSEKSWKIKADMTVPMAWTSGNNKEYQIGVGLFIGKPGGHTVYEVDFSGMANGSRFVLAQNIEDRQSSIDPNYVGIDVPLNMETVKIELVYCHIDNSLSAYYNGFRVDTQPLGEGGFYNWNMGSEFRVGIMAFSEGPASTSNFLFVDNWEVYE